MTSAPKRTRPLAANVKKPAQATSPARSRTRTVQPASRRIDEQVGDHADWRAQALARIRAIIRAADPEIVEEVKWKKPSNPQGVPVWSRHGIICTGETYKNVVKLTFARGASLPDPARLFNSGLDGNTRRAIDIHEGEHIDAAAFQALVKAAVVMNDPLPKRQ